MRIERIYKIVCCSNQCVFFFFELSASIGGYCLLPYQCLCHENHTGDNCDVSVDNSSSLHTAIQGNRCE